MGRVEDLFADSLATSGFPKFRVPGFDTSHYRNKLLLMKGLCERLSCAPKTNLSSRVNGEFFIGQK